MSILSLICEARKNKAAEGGGGEGGNHGGGVGLKLGGQELGGQWRRNERWESRERRRNHSEREREKKESEGENRQQRRG